MGKQARASSLSSSTPDCGCAVTSSLKFLPSLPHNEKSIAWGRRGVNLFSLKSLSVRVFYQSHRRDTGKYAGKIKAEHEQSLALSAVLGIPLGALNTSPGAMKNYHRNVRDCTPGTLLWSKDFSCLHSPHQPLTHFL